MGRQRFEQQSVLLTHVDPVGPQEATQKPPKQDPEQQSPSLVQVPPGAVQAAWHMPPEQFPEQHWAGLVQVPPLAVQAGAVTQAPLTQFWPGPQQTPSQQAWVVGQQVVPPSQKAWVVGHWQRASVQIVPPVQVLLQPAQFVFVPNEVQAPLQQPVPWLQQAT